MSSNLPILQQLNRPLTPQISIRFGWIFWVQWVLATGLGFLLSLLFVEIGVRPHIGTLSGAFGSSFIAIAQWFVLRQRLSQISWWIIATIAAWVLIGSSSLGALGWIAPRTELITIRLLYGFIDGTIVGIVQGLGQWFVLNRYFPNAAWWLPISSLSWALALPSGWAVGGILRSITGLFFAEVIGLTVTWLAIAALSGFGFLRLLHHNGIQ
ncbi:hypothetical protein J0895_01505 [Phormidium pseudopriestleyi FRX01]|uniref:Uncharacterized protein n=1 Tax=Phormidium pseudopriestleyi FRX01 TaxID=1759528 RepID=A0ABS3FL30_9CYAN|nr:hypothetical protein [Phormidium pseudopriestleyi]MBO0347804.1 hypothetical protein [Phormidium pseudopriestleyi FRX01]